MCPPEAAPPPAAQTSRNKQGKIATKATILSGFERNQATGPCKWLLFRGSLTKIAGTGFRRALEFLVKDYASREQPDDVKETICRKPMVQCIKDHIQEEGIKTVAERAAWLGNDETHYLRKWEDKDINDLIDLIDSVSGWIVIHLKTEELKKSMPRP